MSAVCGKSASVIESSRKRAALEAPPLCKIAKKEKLFSLIAEKEKTEATSSNFFINREYGYCEKTLTGRASIIRCLDGKAIDVEVHSWDPGLNKDTILFEVFLPDMQSKASNTCLGCIELKVQTFSRLGFPRQKLEAFGFTDEKSLCEDASRRVVYVARINSYEKKNYKGIGRILMQAAIESSLIKEAEGRLLLDAVKASHGFYSKLGFKATNQKQQEGLLAHFESLKKDPEKKHDYFGVEMFFSKNALEEHLDSIMENPVLLATKEIVQKI